MIDWRTILQAPSAPQNTQNTQKGSDEGHFEDFGDFEYQSRPRLPALKRPSPAEPITIEPAAQHAKPVYWEQADGSIVGGCKPEFLAKVGHGEQASFWIVTEHQGQARWVRSDRLRSRRQFETQAPVHPVELIQEPRRRTPR